MKDLLAFIMAAIAAANISFSQTKIVLEADVEVKDDPTTSEVEGNLAVQKKITAAEAALGKIYLSSSNGTVADFAIASGYQNTSTGNSSLLMGNGNQNAYPYTGMFGFQNITTFDSQDLAYFGRASHSNFIVGSYNTASGFVENSFLAGMSNKAIGQRIAGGTSNDGRTLAVFAVGDSNTVQGYSAFAVGASNMAKTATIAAGFNLISDTFAQFTVGRYNDQSIAGSNADMTYKWLETDPLFVVGNGTAENKRSNALVVYKSGSADLKGDMKVGGSLDADKVKVRTASGGISMGEFGPAQ